MSERKVTVSVCVKFIDMGMESTDDALDIVRGVLITHGETCQAEIRQALEDAGAKSVTVGMTAY